MYYLYVIVFMYSLLVVGTNSMYYMYVLITSCMY